MLDEWHASLDTKEIGCGQQVILAPHYNLTDSASCHFGLLLAGPKSETTHDAINHLCWVEII